MAESNYSTGLRPTGRMSPDELRILISDEVGQAETWANANVRSEQERNLQFYLGLPLGNEVEGRSQVVSWDVFEVIESAMPSFLEPFFSGDNIGEFQPRGPEDEQFASQATDLVNYVIKDQNPGFLLFNQWFKDALLSKVGIVRAEWYEEDPEKVEYADLTGEQLAMLMQDERSEITEHTAKPVPGMPELNQAQIIQMGGQAPMLHDVTVMQKKPGRVCIEGVRPENFVISRGAKSADKAKCIGEFVSMTRSELEDLGYDGAYEVSDFDGGDQGIQSTMQMLRDDMSRSISTDSSLDKSMEEVILFRGYIRADVNGDGIAEYRRVLAGGNMLLEDEEADWHDYCIITPIPVPHRVIGMAYADPAAEIQRMNTALTRQYLDSLYSANNPRTYVNMNAGVVLDDLLSTRINGIVRGKAPAGDAIQPLQTSLVARDALEGIQMGIAMRESRLGLTRYNQGLESDTLNKTATGIQTIMGAADKRQKMTLRIFAETGVKDLFRLVLRLVTKYQDSQTTIRLRNEWVQFDPRSWNPDMDVIIEPGQGSGDAPETVMLLQNFGQFMALGQQNGIVSPQNYYEFGKALAKAMRLKGADAKFLTPPNPNPPPPPPSPEQIKAQMEQMKMQFQAQEEEKKRQDAAYRFQAEQAAQQQTDTNRQEMEARQKQLELAQQADLARLDAEYKLREKEIQLAHDARMAEFDRQTQLLLKQMELSVKVGVHQDEMALAEQNAVRDDAKYEIDRFDRAQEQRNDE